MMVARKAGLISTDGTQSYEEPCRLQEKHRRLRGEEGNQMTQDPDAPPLPVPTHFRNGVLYAFSADQIRAARREGYELAKREAQRGGSRQPHKEKSMLNWILIQTLPNPNNDGMAGLVGGGDNLWAIGGLALRRY